MFSNHLLNQRNLQQKERKRGGGVTKCMLNSRIKLLLINDTLLAVLIILCAYSFLSGKPGREEGRAVGFSHEISSFNPQHLGRFAQGQSLVPAHVYAGQRGCTASFSSPSPEVL